jgi:putative endonuclease
MAPSRKARHIATGIRGERKARRYLRIRGYRILALNYVCPPGEIDIVAAKKGVIVFAEVRTRQAGNLVDPVESINDLKLAHFMDAARYYLADRGSKDMRCRFDIISVQIGGPFSGRVRHYPDAFRIDDERPARGRRIKTWLRMRPRP